MLSRKMMEGSLFLESIEYIRNKFPFYKKTYTHIMDNFNENYFLFANNMCEIVSQKSKSKKEYLKCLDSFIKYSLQYLKLQVELMKTGNYHYQNFSEVNRKIYQSGVMDSYYLDALLLSQVFWPNHYRIADFFSNEFCILLGDKQRGIEIPCGTGVFSFILLSKVQNNNLDVFDISPYATEYTKQILHLSKVDINNVNIENVNLFDLNETNKYDFVICGELIEHVEKPKDALNILNRLLRPHGVIFITTAIYTAAIDHIYLFSDVKEVRELIKKTGFSIDSELVLPVSLAQYNENKKCEPINYACIARKKVIKHEN